MIRSKVLYAGITLMTFCLQGCCPSGPWQQERWHDNILRGTRAVEICRERGSPFLVDKQLVAMVGEPDYKLYPEELELMMTADDSYKESTMTLLYKAYCNIKKKRTGLSIFCKENNWKESESFKRCMLWLYDETIHFSKPLPYCPFCAYDGFVCDFFFLEVSDVIGAIGIPHWKSLETGVSENNK